MNTFELEIWDDESSLCTFYTVRNLHDDVDSISETEKFFIKYEQDEDYKEAIEEMTDLLLFSIGEEMGAVDAFFNRYEDQVHGLPPHGKVKVAEVTHHFKDYPLRLYALRITHEIVVLFNGGVKDGPTNQTSSLNNKWREACQYAIRIEEQLRDKTICVNEHKRTLESADGSNKIIIL